MALSEGKAALKTTLLSLAQRIDEQQTPDEALDQFVNALETFIKTASVTVPGTGLVAPGGGGPVTGTSITGQLE